MSNELKPCPFCGSTSVYVYGRITSGFWVFCQTCAGQSGVTQNKEQAIAAWNNRAEDRNDRRI